MRTLHKTTDVQQATRAFIR